MSADQEPGGAPTNPWDMRPGETARAWAAFCAYRDMGPTRSLRTLETSGHKASTKLAQLGKWSRTFDWTDRAAAWDQHVDHEVQEDQLALIKKMRRQHAAIASNMLGKATQRLLGINPDELTPTQVVQWVEAGVKIERMARGEPGETVGLPDGQDPTGTPIDGVSVMAMLAAHPEAADLAHHLQEAGAITTEETPP